MRRTYYESVRIPSGSLGTMKESYRLLELIKEVARLSYEFLLIPTNSQCLPRNSMSYDE